MQDNSVFIVDDYRDSDAVGVAPVGSVTVPSSQPTIEEVRTLYRTVFGLTVGLRLAAYIAAVAVFFVLPGRWLGLGIIVLLLAGGHFAGKSHAWAWRGCCKYSSSMDRRARAQAAFQATREHTANAAAMASARLSRRREHEAQKAARIQWHLIAKAANERADNAATLARLQATQAAKDARRIADEAREKVSQALVTTSAQKAPNMAMTNSDQPASMASEAKDEEAALKSAECKPVEHIVIPLETHQEREAV